jgi:drug/metabolite transporter (DMT)-like permease
MADLATQSPPPRAPRARAYLFGAAVLFGLASVLVKVAANEGMGGGQATLVRFAVGLASVAALFLLRPGTFRPVRYGLLASRGFFGGLAALLFYLAIAAIPAGEATLINSTFPIWAVMISFLLMGERPTVHLALALLVASSGVFLVLGGGELTFGLGRGELLAVGSAMAGGFAVTSVRALRATDNAPTIFFAMALGGLAVSLPYAFASWPGGAVAWVASGGAGLVAFGAQLLMTEAYGALAVPEAALWQQLTPIAAYLWALSIGERFTVMTALGTVIGIAGVVYGSLLGHRPGPGEPPAEREAAAGLPVEKP